MKLNNVLEKIYDFFLEIDDVQTVYLFGSQAKGKSRDCSDVDLGLLFASKLSMENKFDRLLTYAIDLEELLEKKVDLIDLESADLFFVHQVMLNKIIVIDKDIHFRVSFEVDRRRQFFDMQNFYNIYHSQVLKRLEGRLYSG